MSTDGQPSLETVAASRPEPLYSPLDPAKSEIRLLTLYPGEPTTPIGCDLSVVSLKQPDLQYEAVSYCWGQR